MQYAQVKKDDYKLEVDGCGALRLRKQGWSLSVNVGSIHQTGSTWHWNSHEISGSVLSSSKKSKLLEDILDRLIDHAIDPDDYCYTCKNTFGPSVLAPGMKVVAKILKYSPSRVFRSDASGVLLLVGRKALEEESQPFRIVDSYADNIEVGYYEPNIDKVLDAAITYKDRWNEPPKKYTCPFDLYNIGIGIRADLDRFKDESEGGKVYRHVMEEVSTRLMNQRVVRDLIKRIKDGEIKFEYFDGKKEGGSGVIKLGSGYAYMSIENGIRIYCGGSSVTMHNIYLAAAAFIHRHGGELITHDKFGAYVEVTEEQKFVAFYGLEDPVLMEVTDIESEAKIILQAIAFAKKYWLNKVEFLTDILGRMR